MSLFRSFRVTTIDGLDSKEMEWITSAICPLTLENITSRKRGVGSFIYDLYCSNGSRYILRQIRHEGWMAAEQNLATRERTALTLASRLDYTAPVPIAVYEGKTASEFSLIITTLLDGTDLNPTEFSPQLGLEMARALRCIHSLDCSTELPHLPLYRPKLPGVSASPSPPEWAVDYYIWHEAIRIALQNCYICKKFNFLHGDFHIGNLLWSKDRVLTGMVDWVTACIGPPEADVAHCRWNLLYLQKQDYRNCGEISSL